MKRTPIMDGVDHVLVRRVFRMYNPWLHLDLESGGFARTMEQYPVQREYVEPHRRTDDYDYGRVRFLMEELASGKPLEPIDLDNKWSGEVPVALIMIDGHHRLIAAALLKQRTIPCYYSGAVTALNYLKGKRKTNPFR